MFPRRARHIPSLKRSTRRRRIRAFFRSSRRPNNRRCFPRTPRWMRMRKTPAIIRVFGEIYLSWLMLSVGINSNPDVSLKVYIPSNFRSTQKKQPHINKFNKLRSRGLRKSLCKKNEKREAPKFSKSATAHFPGNPECRRAIAETTDIRQNQAPNALGANGGENAGLFERRYLPRQFLERRPRNAGNL